MPGCGLRRPACRPGAAATGSLDYACSVHRAWNGTAAVGHRRRAAIRHGLAVTHRPADRLGTICS
jgi:hypothetical protein